MSLVIRPAQPEELPAVGALTFDAYASDGFIDGDADYAHELRDAAARADGAELYVAVDEQGVLLGTVTFCPEGSTFREVASAGEAEFRMLGVAPDARRRGVAEALVRMCIERGEELGYDALVLCSMPTQSAAHRLYERLGFVRAPELDWRPFPELELLGFRLELSRPDVSRPG